MYLPILISYYLLIQRVVSQSSCTTPKGFNGECIHIKKCPRHMDILRKSRPISNEEMNFLKSSHCGFVGRFPLVCCQIKKMESSVVRVDEDEESIVEPPDVSDHPNLALLDHEECGQMTVPKIMGGNRAGLFEYPWMALIAYDIKKRGNQFKCGGTIINRRYILTAAHCVTGLPENMSVAGVRIGDHNLGTECDCDVDMNNEIVVCAEKYQDYRIENVHFHPEYTTSTIHNDIALIRLDRNANLTVKNAKPICLPIGTGSAIPGKRMTVTGWGSTEEGPRSQYLLHVSMLPLENKECRQIYQNVTLIWQKQMCVGGEAGKDSCLGDSGGPLQAPGIYYNKRYKYMQYGIVSFGPGSCGKEGFPGVYTRVVYYLDWILDTIRP
ncbi:CLIP domain-containing serine protease B4-like [Prorops nasuta]|uniref:CLIP domain-containing serine protease B4-like n=1 Tax=Prorops nasuta TaxID=863751 RepID=UPI0034CE6026